MAKTQGLKNSILKIRSSIQAAPSGLALALAAGLGLSACDFFDSDKTCTDEERNNLYVSSKYGGKDSTLTVRERQGGRRDTSLDLAQCEGQPCFSEYDKNQRILILKDGKTIDSSAWFRQEEDEDGCHQKSKTITF